MPLDVTDGMPLRLQFPSRWNGEPDGGPSHDKRVAYPDGMMGGDCPQYTRITPERSFS